MGWHRLVIGLTTLIASALAAATTAPRGADEAGVRPFTAHYELVLNGLTVGEAKARLQRKQDHWVYHRESNLNGLAALLMDQKVVEEATFQLDGARLKPLRFHYRHREGEEVKREQIRFDWGQGQARASYKDTTRTLTIPEGAVDRMTLELVLMRAVGSDVDDKAYKVVNKAKLKTWVFERLGREVINTPAGRFEAVKVGRARDADKPRKTIYWLVEELGYVPAKVEHHEDGGPSVSLRLRELAP